MTRLLVRPFFAHLAAMAAALFFAWHVSQSALAKTAVQFIAPLMIIMAIHLLWLAFARRMTQGYAQTIYGRSAVTGLLMMLLLLGGSILAPAPAQAQAGDAVQSLLIVVFCVFFIAVIVGVAGLVVWALFRIIFWLFDKKKDPDDPDERLNDGASLIAAMGLLAVASAEGVSDRISFEARGQATASFVIDGPATDVWAAMQTATSPEFPLPAILSSFPQPVAG